jgi:hypothetical protein
MHFTNLYIIIIIIYLYWLIHSCFSLNRLPKVNGIYVGYLSDLTFLFCPSLQGLKNSLLEKRKAGTLSTLRIKESTVWFLSYVFRTMALSFVPHVRVTWYTRFYLAVERVAAPRTPHPEDYSVTYSASALLALPTF